MKNYKFLRKEKFNVGISIWAQKIYYTLISHQGNQSRIQVKGEYSAANPLEVLKEIKKEASHYPCYLALPHRNIILRTISFEDPLNETEAIKFFALNSEKYFSYPSAAINFDFEFITKQKNKIRVVGAKKEFIDRWKRYFRQAQLNLCMVSTDVLALERYLTSEGYVDSRKNYAVFLAKGNELLQIVFVEGLVSFVHSDYLSSEEIEHQINSIKKFFCLYETSKSYRPIQTIIYLNSDEKLIHALRQNISLPFKEIDFSNHGCLLVNYLLSLGMAAAC
jgi:Tfp pilus assembly PilM family ATPase